MYYNKEYRRRIFYARSKNISIRSASNKYSMVRVFSRSIDRDQSFFPGCFDIPFFFILVINTGGWRNLETQFNISDYYPLFSNSNKLEKRKNKSGFNLSQTRNWVQTSSKFTLIKSLIKLRDTEVEMRLGQQYHTRSWNKIERLYFYSNLNF